MNIVGYVVDFCEGVTEMKSCMCIFESIIFWLGRRGGGRGKVERRIREGNIGGPEDEVVCDSERGCAVVAVWIKYCSTFPRRASSRRLSWEVDSRCLH